MSKPKSPQEIPILAKPKPKSMARPSGLGPEYILAQVTLFIVDFFITSSLKLPTHQGTIPDILKIKGDLLVNN
jgi:hypothetical protein